MYTHGEKELKTYYLSVAEAKELEEALRDTGSFAHRGKSFAEQQALVDALWRKIAARCNCDFDTITPTSPPKPSAFRAVPLPPKPSAE
jgi:hypothetical protein